MAELVDLDALELDPALFRAWLEANASTLVGYAGYSWNCPVACWLREMYGGLFLVSSTHVSFVPRVGGTQERFAPDWVRRFVLALDEQFADVSVVVGIDALEALDYVLGPAAGRGDLHG